MLFAPKTILAALAISAAAPAAAQIVEECDWRASLHAVVEPLESHSRTFANGAVRLTVTDTIEPAAGSFHIVVVGPPYDELGGSRCQVVTLGAAGFGGVRFDALEADYDPALGLRWMVPVDVYNPNTSDFDPFLLIFTLNQSTGEMTADLAR